MTQDWRYLYELCRRIEQSSGRAVQIEGRDLDTSSYNKYIQQIKEIYGSSEQD